MEKTKKAGTGDVETRMPFYFIAGIVVGFVLGGLGYVYFGIFAGGLMASVLTFIDFFFFFKTPKKGGVWL